MPSIGADADFKLAEYHQCRPYVAIFGEKDFL